MSQMAIRAMSAVAALFFVWNIARFFPNPSGDLGYDYGLFVPWMIAGFFWQTINGTFSPAEFIPSFCGGVPFLFNPQSMYYSLPQLLLAVLPPVQSLLVSWVVFGLFGYVCMYAFLQRVFKVSASSASLGAAIFLLNGFFTARMAIGHVTYHGVMLWPAIALAVFSTPPDMASRGQAAFTVAVRSVLTGLLLAYLFYSGGTNIMLPMALAMVIMGLMVRLVDRWRGEFILIGFLGCLLGLALCAYKLLPALEFAANVVRPVSLRMSGDLLSLIAGAAVSLFVPQLLSHIDRAHLIVDRAELEYGVGIVPLLVCVAGFAVAIRRRNLLRGMGPLGEWRPIVLALMSALLVVPILVNYDAPGFRWLMLHLPIVQSMSVMLRFWFAYIPLLCVLTPLLMDYLVPNASHRDWWCAAAVAFTIIQCGATDMTYYSEQSYSPAPIATIYEKVRRGGQVPPISRIADPWLVNDKINLPYTSRNDAVIDGTSDFPCYEPMFGYRMEVFIRGRLAPGPVLEARSGLLNLKNPVCYVFPKENHCRPGDEFTSEQFPLAQLFAAYRPFPYIWPIRQYVAAAVAVAAGTVSLTVLIMAGLQFFFVRFSTKRNAPTQSC